MQKYGQMEQAELKNSLYFASTIYESFEALEEVMGKLKLERPLFLIYLAKKAFAEEVFKAAGEEIPPENEIMSAQNQSYVEIFNPNYH